MAFGTQHTVIVELGHNADSEAICAFFSAYVAAQATTYRASGKLMPLFVVLCMRSLNERLADGANRTESYGDAYATAKKVLDTFGLSGSWEAFHRIWGATHPWQRPADFLLPHVAVMQQVVDAMLQQESRKWKPDA
ncbi:MAG: hypothetical protein V4459_12160 [Pseudomonadota bacterium]